MMKELPADLDSASSMHFRSMFLSGPEVKTSDAALIESDFAATNEESFRLMTSLPFSSPSTKALISEKSCETSRLTAFDVLRVVFTLDFLYF
jgi:hypothetical protein